MSIYIKPVLTACYVFPILAALFTLPYMLHQYRKYGALLMLRVVIVYTFIFYMMTSYFMTILPLPPIDSVSADSASVLLVPFDAVRLLLRTSGFQYNNASTYFNLLKDPNLYQILFNILLLLPFGVYLRYYFNRKWYQVLLLSFVYSLFFELTQLSGLYGIYPHPYRFFEVDDLICNTLGGILGFVLTPAFSFFLPDRERLDQMSYRKGENVSMIRRFFAFVLDQLSLIVLFTLFVKAIDILPISNIYFNDQMKPFMTQHRFLCYVVLSILCISIVMICSRGKTLGKAFLKIRIANNNGNHPNAFRMIARTFLLYGLILPYNIYVSKLIGIIPHLANRDLQFLMVLLVSVMIVAFIMFIFHLLRRFTHHDSIYLYDRLLRLKSVSTILHQEPDIKSNKIEPMKIDDIDNTSLDDIDINSSSPDDIDLNSSSSGEIDINDNKA